MVDRAIVSALGEFLSRVWRPSLQLLVVAAFVSVVTITVALRLVSDRPEERLGTRLPTAGVVWWCLLASLVAGSVAMLYHRSLVVVLGVAWVGAAMAAAGWATYRSSGWTGHRRVSEAMPAETGEFATHVLVLGVLVGVYFAYIGFRVHRTVTDGLTPAQLQRVEPAATLFAAKAVLPLYGMLAVGIAVLFLLLWFWDRAQQWLQEELAKRNPATAAVTDWSDLQRNRTATWTLGGVLLVVGAVGWIVLSPAARDVVVALVGGLAVVEGVTIFDSVRTLRGLEAGAYPEAAIESELKLQGAEIIVHVFSIGAALLLGALIVDVATAAYYHAVLVPAARGFQPPVAGLLAAGAGSPTDVIHYFAFYAGGDTFFSLAVSLLTVLLPVIVVVFVLPYGVEYLYFRDYRTAVIAALTLVGVVLLHIVIELVVSGEITHLTALSVTSLLPTISAGLSGSAVEWLKEEVGHAHCPSCDTRVDQASNYCDHCGVRLVTCPNCGEFSAVEDGACVLCNEPGVHVSEVG